MRIRPERRQRPRLLRLVPESDPHMTLPAAPDPIAAFSQRLGREWPSIASARRGAIQTKASLDAALGEFTSEDTSVVIFGSLARQEMTSGSDLDWVLLVDGSASSEHLDAALAIEDRLANKKVRGPGASATFGGLVFSHDLINYIGGEDDSNRNLTLRMLLLLESTPVGRIDAHNRVVNNILRRYIVEDFGFMHDHNPMNVPRFLQNDIARYWRTLAVDFAYKRRQRAGRGWALRTAKLRLSRKLTYASGLLMCYSCALDPVLGLTTASETTATLQFITHLGRYARASPLDVFADLFLARDPLLTTGGELFDAYDGFLALLDDPVKRKRLDELKVDQVADDPIYQQVRTFGHRFQHALNEIFFSEEKAPDLFALTKTYGVF